MRMVGSTLTRPLIIPYFEYNVITGYSYYTDEKLILNKR